MSFLQGANDVAISGGTQVAATAGRDLSITINHGSQVGTQSNTFRDLAAHAAHAALHNSSARFPAPRCHRNTRTTYLDHLEHWMTGKRVETELGEREDDDSSDDDSSDDDSSDDASFNDESSQEDVDPGEKYAHARLIWLTGGAGAGKSAIMQSVVERTIHLGVILGTFFFSRADSSRNHAEVLIPTLAYQLASAFSAAMAVLGPIIERNPLIFKASLETQTYELLVRPLHHLAEIGIIDPTSAPRRVFVIDGLDECDDPRKQALIIHTIATVLCDHNIPISFLVASRPEVAIAQAVERESSMRSVLATMTLDANDEAESDIRQYIEDSFQDILNSHPLRTHIPPNWPARDSVDELVRKSSGHFVYAATAMKYISSSLENPARSLRVIEGLETSRIGTPFAELDALYRHIITSASYSSQVLTILRHCALSWLDHSVATICYMHPSFSPDEVALVLFGVQALVSLLPNNEGAMLVQIRHASLGDFLKDARRCGTLHIKQEQYITPLFPRYFQILHDGPRGTYIAPGGFVIIPVVLNLITAMRQVATQRPVEVFGLLDLLRNHSPMDIWNFCEYHPEASNTPYPLLQVSDYLCSIRELVRDIDEALYDQQFGAFIRILLKLSATKPWYSTILAFLFTSCPYSLPWLPPLLLEIYPPADLDARDINSFFIFSFLGPRRMAPRSWRAIRSCPESLHDWGSHLVPLLRQILAFLLNCSWSPMAHTHTNHGRRSPLSRKLLRLECTSRTAPKWHDTAYRRLELSSNWCHRFNLAQKVGRRRKCEIHLETVIHYLPNTECTSDIAKLARRSLPLAAAIWYPRMMKKARAAMDAYVRRWEESLQGISEKTQSMAINEMD